MLECALEGIDVTDSAENPLPTAKMRSFVEFLESAPPDVAEVVSDRTSPAISIGGVSRYLNLSDLQLHCEECNGLRMFKSMQGSVFLTDSLNHEFLQYECRNCQSARKVFSVVIKGMADQGLVQKLGELPPFGPPTPARVFKLIGEEYRELFLQGRRAENRGLGIGAYAYYRRIVEHQKGKIIQEIGKVAKKLGASPETVKIFSEASAERQFSKAIGMVKDGFPPILLFSNHNPLSLLHDALSDGLHEFTDEECLEHATTIRLVLTELSERITTTLKENAELESAVGRLISRKSKAPEK
jgi:hypothetical protein